MNPQARPGARIHDRIPIPALAGILLIGVSLASCVTSPTHEYTYNEIRLVNRSNELVRNVTIRVPATGRVFNCGNIAPRGLCADRFDPRPYQYNPIEVEWTHGAMTGQTEEFTVQVPAGYSTSVPLQGVIEISPGGGMSAFFVQEGRGD